MVKINRDDIYYLARLARIELSDQEADSLRAELESILGYVEQLQDVNVDGLKPTTQVTGLVNVTREDDIIDYGVDPAKLLRLAPSQESQHIKTKRMVA